MLLFFLGLLIGLGIGYWRLKEFDRTLRRLLKSLIVVDQSFDDLSPLATIRREFTQFNSEKNSLLKIIKTHEKLLEYAPIGYLQVDEENQLLWCNSLAQDWLKITRWQVGQVRLLLEVVRSYELDRLIEKTRQKQSPQVKEWAYYPTVSKADELGKKSRSLVLKASSFPLPDGQVGVFLENQQPLIELSQSRERAFSDLTHELKTPLTSIYLVSETLEKRLTHPEKSWVNQMLREITRLIQLVEDWLELTRYTDRPEDCLNYEIIDLIELINNAWETLLPIAHQKEIDLIFNAENQVEMMADPLRLSQVLINLLDNAIKHSPEKSKIELTLQKQEDSISLEIRDSGSGFAPDDLPHVFERLYRGDRSRVRYDNRSGSGLGLAIVEQIVKAHQGKIVAENHPQTQNAVITLDLPLKPFHNQDLT